jgi:hypothetical protein
MFLDVWTPLTTVSKIILHKLYKIVSDLFLESLKTRFFAEFRFVRFIFRQLNNICLFDVP